MKRLLLTVILSLTVTGITQPETASAQTKITPKCNTPTKEGDASCYLEIKDKPGCFLWNANPKDNEFALWSGACSNNLPQGKGEEFWSDGSEGTGRLVDGKAYGRWEWRFADGNVATGPYVDGKEHGRWEWRFANGTVETGPYVDGKMNGLWEERWADGGVQIGPYVDGKKHGRWERRRAHGTLTILNYVNDKLQ